MSITFGFDIISLIVSLYCFTFVMAVFNKGLPKIPENVTSSFGKPGQGSLAHLRHVYALVLQ